MFTLKIKKSGVRLIVRGTCKFTAYRTTRKRYEKWGIAAWKWLYKAEKVEFT